MAGLNFQTCTVVNSANKDDFKFSENVLRIINHGDFTFEKAKVTKFVKKEYAQFTPASATIALTLSSNKFYRLEVITDMEDSPIMTTALPNNGTSYCTEFDGNTSVKTVAANLEKTTVFGKNLFDVTSSDTNLTITAKGEYIRIKSVKLYELDYLVAPVKVATGTITKGVNSFGSYSHLSKDLRLSTFARAGIAPVNAEEMPVVGGKYDQYIITYEAPANHTGMQAVGQKLENVTTHVFWVNQAISADLVANVLTNLQTAESDLDD